jgi:hypothetical protein
LERGEPNGIWGGLDRRDRKRIAVEYGYPVPAMLPEHGTNARRAKHGCDCEPCKQAHARYERERRVRHRNRLNLWRAPLYVVRPCVIGHRRVSRGQYLLPLPGLPGLADTTREPALHAAA